MEEINIERIVEQNFNENIDRACGGRVYINYAYSYPSYLIRYLEAFGIKVTYKLEKEQAIPKYSYKNEELNIRVEDNYIIFSSPTKGEYVAKIDMNNNTVKFRDNNPWNFASVEEISNYRELLLKVDGRIHHIEIILDMLGNIDVAYSHNRACHIVPIRIGEKHDIPENYLAKLYEQIDFTELEEKDQRFIGAMFNDPRLLNWLSKGIRMMDCDIETAYQNKVNIIKNRYLVEIKKIIEKQNEDIDELTRYKEKYLRELNKDGEDVSKGK